MKQQQPVKPMLLWESLLMFGIPAAIAAGCQYVVWPQFTRIGISPENGYYWACMIAFSVLLTAAVLAYALEGHPLQWQSFKQRYRLGPMRWREWKWTLAGLLVFLPLAYLTQVAAVAIYDLLEFVPPEIAPPGAITNIPLYLVGLLLNVVGEELWWRGYVLPRQEQYHGKHAWWVHGILWACFHAFKWWAVPFMLLTTWIVPFIAQRLKNSSSGLISHAITNGLGALLTLLPYLSG